MISAIYWKLHTAFLLNRQDEARFFLGMLKDEIARSPGDLRRELRPAHRTRLKKIEERMRLGLYCRLFGDGIQGAINQWHARGEKTGEERKFCRKLCTRVGKQFLFSAIEAPDTAIIVSELEMGEYGRCDLAIEAGRVRWVIEVKMGEAPDSVACQADKYRLAEELQMCLGLNDEVRPYVLAGSFPKYVLSELPRNGIGMLLHDGTPESIKILSRHERIEEEVPWETDPTMSW